VAELDDLVGEISHLCHNSLCVNPAHLCLEPHHVNQHRSTCVGRGHCYSHPGFPDCLLHLKL
jgi:hypothetical protein